LGAGDAEDVYGEGMKFSIGKATVLRDGDDATIITTGIMMADGLKAGEQLSKEGIKARVLQMASIKPLDEEV
jgi:transketolase